MKWSRALLLVTAFSYFGAAFLTLVGYPPEATIPPNFQAAIYVFLGLTLLTIIVEGHVVFVDYLLALLYGVLAGTSFSGIQKWINYNGSSDLLGVAMAAWDLAIAIALLDEVDQAE